MKLQSLAVLLLLGSYDHVLTGASSMVDEVENREGPGSSMNRSDGTGGGTSLRGKSAAAVEMMMADGPDSDKVKGMGVSRKLEKLKMIRTKEELDMEEIGTEPVFDAQHGVDVITDKSGETKMTGIVGKFWSEISGKRRSPGLDPLPQLDVRQDERDGFDPLAPANNQGHGVTTVPGTEMEAVSADADVDADIDAHVDVVDKQAEVVAEVLDVKFAEGREGLSNKMNLSSSPTIDDHDPPTAMKVKDNHINIVRGLGRRHGRGLNLGTRKGRVGITRSHNKSLLKDEAPTGATFENALVGATSSENYEILSFNSSSIEHHQERKLLIFVGFAAVAIGIGFWAANDGVSFDQKLNEVFADVSTFVQDAFEALEEASGEAMEYLEDVFSCPDGNTGDGCSVFCPCNGENTCEAWHHVCRAPGKENDPCHLTRPCGRGLTCEAGSHTCRKPGEVGDPCHLTRPCKEELTCSAKFYCEEGGSTGDPCDMGILLPCNDDHFCMPVLFQCIPGETFVEKATDVLKSMEDVGGDLLDLLSEMVPKVAGDLISDLFDGEFPNGDAINDCVKEFLDGKGEDDVNDIFENFTKKILDSKQNRRLQDSLPDDGMPLTFYAMFSLEVDLPPPAGDVAFSIGYYVDTTGKNSLFFDFGLNMDLTAFFGKMTYTPDMAGSVVFGLLIGGAENLPGNAIEFSVGFDTGINSGGLLVGLTLPSPLPYFELSFGQGMIMNPPGFDFYVGGGHSWKIDAYDHGGHSRRRFLELDAIPNPYNLSQDLLKEQTKKMEKVKTMFPKSYRLSDNCTHANGCGVCEGSCKYNHDCLDGLECWHHSHTMSTPPGCNGITQSGFGYCFNPSMLRVVEESNTFPIRSRKNGYYMRVAKGDCTDGLRLDGFRLGAAKDLPGDKRGEFYWGNEGQIYSAKCPNLVLSPPEIWNPIRSTLDRSKCMDAMNLDDSNVVQNLQRVYINQCDSKKWSQQWHHDSKGRLVLRHGGGQYCMEAGTEKTLYAAMFVFKCHDGDHQKWDHREDGRLKNRGHGLFIGTRYCKLDVNTSVQLRSRDYGDCGMAQLWSKVTTTTKVALREYRSKAWQKWEVTKSSGLATVDEDGRYGSLDVYGLFTTPDGGLDQQFDFLSFITSDSSHTPSFYIRDRKRGRYVTVDDGKCANKLGLSMQGFNGSQRQLFTWKSGTGNGNLLLQSVACKDYIVENSEGHCGRFSLYLYKYEKSPWQEWRLNGASLESKNCAGSVMDSTQSGDLVLYKYHGGSNQQFDLLNEEYKKSPLNTCEGACNFDHDCKDNLKCWKRPGTPPGCLGAPRDESVTTYCYDPEIAVDVIQSPVDRSLSMCEGNCFEDSDCEKHLKCWRRSGDEDGPPNCKGELTTGWGYCSDETFTRSVGWNLNNPHKGWNQLRLKDDWCAEYVYAEPVRLRKCKDSNVQRWKIDSYGRLKNEYSNKCLSVRADSDHHVNNGDTIYAMECNNSSKQRWIREIDGRYRNRKDKKYVLGVSGSGNREGLKKDLSLHINEDVDNLAIGDVTCGQTWNIRTGDCAVGPKYLKDSETSLPWLEVCDGDCNKDNDCAPGLKCFERGWSGPGPEQCKGKVEHYMDYCYGTKIESFRYRNKRWQKYLTAPRSCEGQVIIEEFSESMRQEFYIDKDGMIASVYCRGKVLDLERANCDSNDSPRVILYNKKDEDNSNQKWIFWNSKNEKGAGGMFINKKCKGEPNPIVMAESYGNVIGYQINVDGDNDWQTWQVV